MLRSPSQRLSLGLWVGLRLCVLAALAVVGAAVGMWCYFQYHDYKFLSSFPPKVREELLEMRKHPEENRRQLWEHVYQYYDVAEFFPGLSNPDWLMVGVMLACELPLLIWFGMRTAQPISRDVGELARTARRVASGDFQARIHLRDGAPRDIEQMAADFNDMATRLEQYELELRESSAMLAHELRTPLNAAMGRLQGMLDEVFPLESVQLETVQRQLNQINRLVNDLHFISLARAGKMELVTERFALLALVSERISWAHDAIKAAEIRCEVDVPKDLHIDADHDRIGQVLSILIDNATRYGAAGGLIQVYARTKGSVVRIVVGDRGEGVSESSLQRLRERFWRADESRHRNFGGSGLGLAIADAICRAHGGSLAFENRTGGGLLAVVELDTARQPRPGAKSESA